MSRFRLDRFEVKSLAKAIYTICAWPSNRAYVGLVDNLNRDFLDYEENRSYGKKSINTYQDFVRFFTEVKENYLLGPFSLEGLEVDTGQVNFFSDINHKYYSIFIGNGSEDVYESCYLADKLSSYNSADTKVWTSILEYENKIIKVLYPKKKIPGLNFSCPDKDFFILIQNHYMSFQNQDLANYFENYKSENSELYSFFSKVNRLPIFLPLMKEVFEEKLEYKKDINKLENISKYALKERLVNNFYNSVVTSPDYLFDVSILNDEGKKFVSNIVALFHNHNCILFIPSGEDSEEVKIKKTLNRSDSIKLYGKKRIGNNVKVEIPSDYVSYQFLEIDNISPNHSKLNLKESNKNIPVSIKDIIGIMNFAHSIGEMAEFIESFMLNHEQNNQETILTSGYSGLFQIWQQENHVINEGAEPSIIFTQPYTQVNANIEFFDSIDANFPYDAGLEFLNPHHWFLREKDSNPEYNSDLSLLGKGNDLFVEIYAYENKSILYCESNTFIEDVKKTDTPLIQSYRETILSGLKRHKLDILKLTKNKYLKIIITSNEIVQANKNKTIIDGLYSKKVIVNDSGMQTVLVSPKWKTILHDSINEHSRIFENNLLDDIVKELDFENYIQLQKKLHIDDSDKRIGAMMNIAVEYFIDPNTDFIEPKDTSFKIVRHIIAEVVHKENIESGTYSDYALMKPLRLFRNQLRDRLVELIKKYDKKQLVYYFLNIHADIIFQVHLHQKRLDDFKKADYIDEDSIKKFENRTIILREKAREYQRVLEYLIEVTLVNGESNKQHKSNKNDREILIAFAKWILNFQEVSDGVNFGAFDWVSMDVESDGVVSLIPTEHAKKISDEIVDSKYKYGNYDYRNNNLDHRYFEMYKNAFFQDTNLDFVVMITVLKFLYENGHVEGLRKNNIISVFKNIVESDVNILAHEFVNYEYGSVEDFYKVIRFLTLDTSKLVNKNGFIPTWEKKKRVHKYSAQPILFINNKLVYSPIALFQVYRDWSIGAENFVLPYQTGMENTKRVLNKWKQEYEKEIVNSVESLFSKNEYDTYINKELYKLDKKSNHPRNIGDYDVIAINRQSHIVWIIEVKYLRLNQTALENIDGQSEYFLSKKSKGQKFLRRVKYFAENLDKIMSNMNYKGHFRLKSFFVTNKITRSQFEQFPFEIVGFNEFKNIVSRY